MAGQRIPASVLTSTPPMAVKPRPVSDAQRASPVALEAQFDDAMFRSTASSLADMSFAAATPFSADVSMCPLAVCAADTLLTGTPVAARTPTTMQRPAATRTPTVARQSPTAHASHAHAPAVPPSSTASAGGSAVAHLSSVRSSGSKSPARSSRNAASSRHGPERSLVEGQLWEEERMHAMSRAHLAAAREMLAAEQDERALAEERAAACAAATATATQTSASAEAAFAKVATESEALKQALFTLKLKALTLERSKAEALAAATAEAHARSSAESSCREAQALAWALEQQLSEAEQERLVAANSAQAAQERLDAAYAEMNEARRLLTGAREGVAEAVDSKLGKMLHTRAMRRLRRLAFDGWRREVAAAAAAAAGLARTTSAEARSAEIGAAAGLARTTSAEARSAEIGAAAGLARTTSAEAAAEAAEVGSHDGKLATELGPEATASSPDGPDDGLSRPTASVSVPVRDKTRRSEDKSPACAVRLAIKDGQRALGDWCGGLRTRVGSPQQVARWLAITVLTIVGSAILQPPSDTATAADAAATAAFAAGTSRFDMPPPPPPPRFAQIFAGQPAAAGRGERSDTQAGVERAESRSRRRMSPRQPSRRRMPERRAAAAALDDEEVDGVGEVEAAGTVAVSGLASIPLAVLALPPIQLIGTAVSWAAAAHWLKRSGWVYPISYGALVALGMQELAEMVASLLPSAELLQQLDELPDDTRLS